LFLVVVCFLSKSAFSETGIDSLNKLLKSAAIELEEESIIYSKLAKYYKQINSDSAEHFARKGLNLANKIKSERGIVKNYIELAHIYLTHDSLHKSINYYLEAAKYFNDYSDTADMVILWLKLGSVYERVSLYSKALDVYFKGLKLAEAASHSDIPRYYNNIAVIYEIIEDFDNAVLFNYQASLYFQKHNNREELGYTYNNIGIVYARLKNYDSSIVYFEKAMELFDENSDTYGFSNVYFNIGRVYSIADSIDLAHHFYQKGINATEALDVEFGGSKKYLQGKLNYSIGELYNHTAKYRKAIPYFIIAYTNSTRSSNIETAKLSAFELSIAYENLGLLDSSLFFYKNYTIYNDSFNLAKNDQKIAQLGFQYELEKEKEQQEINTKLLKNKHRQKELTYVILLVGIGLLLLLLIFYYVVQRNIMKRNALKRANLLLKKENLEKELDYKNKQLTTNVMYLIRKNEFIEKISKRLKHAFSNYEDGNQGIIEGILFDLDKSSSNDLWKEFEIRFQEVHRDFYEKLINKFPDLTLNEQKLCAFLYLKMSTKEIASVTYQSIDSLRTARYRLRKKLGLNRDENLVNFLSRL
jgi:tetratricopeptide (TPR) repeat protein/DNA-binding CsgD family transcriptional regulator